MRLALPALIISKEVFFSLIVAIAFPLSTGLAGGWPYKLKGEKTETRFLSFFCISSLFFSVPAVGAQFAGAEAGGGYHIVQAVVAEGGELKGAADFLHHGCVFGGIGVGVKGQLFLRLIPLQPGDDPSGYQIHFGGGTGKIQVFASVHNRRAGQPDMHLFGPAVV